MGVIPPIPRRFITGLVGFLFLGELVYASQINYLVFHGSAEIFSIAVAASIFATTWNARRFIDNPFFLFLGVAYLSVAVLDSVHMLAYKGMGVFPQQGADLATQLWIAARLVESVSLLAASLWVRRKLDIYPLFIVYALVTLLILADLLHLGLFPTCYVEGIGPTSFKMFTELVICLLLAVSAVLLWRARVEFDARVLRLIVASVVVTILSELSFCLYVDVYGFFNMLGHVLKIVSFYLIYRAIIVTGLNRPYDLLFRGLKERERELKRLSFEDDLTGLFNRRGFMALAHQQLKLGRRIGRGVMLMVFDMDGMKRINDTHGHAAGDMALREFGNLLRETYRETDVVGRVGGDEFAVLMLETSDDRDAVVGSRMNDSLSTFNDSGNLPAPLSAAVGLATAPPSESSSLADLMERADQDMYEDKKRRSEPR